MRKTFILLYCFIIIAACVSCNIKFGQQNIATSMIAAENYNETYYIFHNELFKKNNYDGSIEKIVLYDEFNVEALITSTDIYEHKGTQGDGSIEHKGTVLLCLKYIKKLNRNWLYLMQISRLTGVSFGVVRKI